MSARRARGNGYSSKLPERYSEAGMLRAEMIRVFCAEHLVHLGGGKVAFTPLEPVRFQLDNIILPIFADLDRKGRRRVRKALISLPRDGAKTELGAALVLACMFLEHRYQGQYYVVARDREQAHILFDKARAMVLHDGDLSRSCQVFKSSIQIAATGAVFQVLPGDEKSVQGRHADVCVIDEYHVHKDTGVYDAMSSGMIGNWETEGLLIVLSTAGPERKGPLWELIPMLRRDSHGYVYWCGADDEDDPHDSKVWKDANPMPWITVPALKTAHDTLPLWEFERYHLNRFPVSKGAARAFRWQDWQKCLTLPLFDDYTPCFVGVDAASKRDTSAVVLDQRSTDGHHNLRTWVFRASDITGQMDFEAIEQLLRDLCAENYVEQVLVDPYFMTRSSSVLASEGLPMVDLPQSDAYMIPAADNLHELIRRHLIRAGKTTRAGGTGADELTTAILNCGVHDKPGRGWRLTKLHEEERIDAAVALAMAARAAEQDANAGGGAFVIGG